MSTLRQDVTTRDWVIFAPERARRFDEQQPEPPERRAEPRPCPFCRRGDDALAPEDVLSVPAGPGWRVRVLRNNYPALQPGADAARTAEGGLFQHMGGHGAHEVVIEAPEHDARLARLDLDHVELLLDTLRGRVVEHLRDPRVQTVVVFKNHGRRDHVGHLRPAPGERPGHVERDDAHLGQVFQVDAALDQHPVARGTAERRDEGDGDGDRQGAGSAATTSTVARSAASRGSSPNASAPTMPTRTPRTRTTGL